MNLIKLVAVVFAATVLTACGGGGDAGTSPFGASTAASSPGTGGTGSVPGTTVTSTATSISFASVIPAGQALLIQGATASGRTDTATLKFLVVDQVGAPVPNVTVNFVASPSTAVTLGIGSAVTDASGIATTSVTSKAVPTNVVVTASLASNAAIRAVSNSLNISGGDPVQTGFQIAAAKYNLDGSFIGATTVVSAFVGDVNGNPAPDGFLVNFTTDAGRIGGGCSTVNGECNVTFTVQNPFGSGVATVHAQGVVNGSTTVSQDIQLNLAGAGGGVYQLANSSTAGAAAVTGTTLLSCKQDVIYYLSDGNDRAAAAGATVAVALAGNGGAASIKLGTPVADALDGQFTPTMVIVSYDLTGITTSNTCVNGGAGTAHDVDVQFLLKTPNNIQVLQSIRLTYPH
jgi:hypothetical protein